MKKLENYSSTVVFLGIWAILGLALPILAQADVPATAFSNTGVAVAVPQTSLSNAGVSVTVPQTSLSNTGSAAATPPATSLSNASANVFVPATSLSNAGVSVTVPQTSLSNTGSAAATPPATSLSNAGANVFLPATSLSNAGVSVTVPQTSLSDTGAAIVSVPQTSVTNSGAARPNNATPSSSAVPSSSLKYSGGGGAVILFSAPPCGNVVYGQWGASAGGWQYRDVVSQNPAGCALTAAQQNARSKYSSGASQILGEKIYADGSLLRGPDWKVYKIVSGQKQLIRDWQELFRNHKKQTIYNVDFKVLDRYAVFSPAKILSIKIYADGSLLRGPDRRVYRIINRRKQLVKNWQELFRKYKRQVIYNVSQETLKNYLTIL